MTKPAWTTWKVQENCPHLIIAKAMGDKLKKINFTCEKCIERYGKGLCKQYELGNENVLIDFMKHYFRNVHDNKNNFVVGKIYRLVPRMVTITHGYGAKQVGLPIKVGIYTAILKQQQWDGKFFQRFLLFETDPDKGYVEAIHYIKKLEDLVKEENESDVEK